MSYTRSVYSSIYVSGTTTAHYPPSEHGGSMAVSYSETVPVVVNVEVNTDDFDRSVDKASAQVDLLTGAVTALEAAQSLEIRKNGERISNQLIRNFYGLIQNDLSMQQTENKSSLQAKFALLMSLSKDMAQKHERMSDDIAKLHRHYKKIFDGLDDDLKRRIRELDMPVFRLSEKTGGDLIRKPFIRSTSASVIGMVETSRIGSQLQTARIKDRTSQVIERITGSIQLTQGFTNATSALLYPGDTGKQEREFIPTMYVRTKDLSGNQVQQVIVPNVGNREQIRSSVEEVIRQSDETVLPQQSAEEWERIEQALLKKMETSVNDEQLDPRVYQQMLNLWNQNKAEL